MSFTTHDPPYVINHERARKEVSEMGFEMALRQEAMRILRHRFATYGHHPSPQMFRGLWEIQKVLTKQAVGDQEAVSNYYLSSLDPGVGKTTAITSWIDAWLDMAQYLEGGREVGVIICFDRLEEIANRVLRIPTLAERRSDSLDFHELGVWRIKQALKAAYEAGQNDAK